MESRRVYIDTSIMLKPQNAGAGQIAARAAFNTETIEDRIWAF